MDYNYTYIPKRTQLFNADSVYSYLNTNSLPVHKSPISNLQSPYISRITGLTDYNYSPSTIGQQQRNLKLSSKIRTEEDFTSSSFKLQIKNKYPIIDIREFQNQKNSEREYPQKEQENKGHYQSQNIKKNDSEYRNFENEFPQVTTQTNLLSKKDNGTQTDPVEVSCIKESRVENPMLGTQNLMFSLKTPIFPPPEETEQTSRPRKVVSVFEKPSESTLLQLIKNNDPQIYKEIKDMIQYKGVSQFVTVISGTLDETLEQREPEDERNEMKNEINNCATMIIKNFVDVLDKILQALEAGRTQTNSFLHQLTHEGDQFIMKQQSFTSNQDNEFFHTPWESQHEQEYKINEYQVYSPKEKSNEFPPQNKQSIGIQKKNLQIDVSSNKSLQESLVEKFYDKEYSRKLDDQVRRLTKMMGENFLPIIQNPLLNDSQIPSSNLLEQSILSNSE